MTKAYPFINVNILEVRPALFQRHGSGRDIDLIEFADKIKGENSGYAAHSVGWIVYGHMHIFRLNINGFVFAHEPCLPAGQVIDIFEYFLICV
jgi:hypothetical protein